MNIIIVGCGKVGKSIIKHLVSENHKIAVIDLNQEVVTEIVNGFDILGIVGNGASHSVLQEAGIENADIFIAVTESDELNLLCCTLAKKTSGAKTIARVRNPIYTSDIHFIKEELGVSMVVNPELEASLEILRVLKFPQAIKIEAFSRGRIELLEFELEKNSILDGVKIMDLSKKIKAEVLVCGVRRKDEAFIPNGSFVIEAGDVLGIICTHKEAKKFFKELGIKSFLVKDSLIVGGGKLAYYLASKLLKIGIKVKIIERDKKRSEDLASLLDQATIINADATNEEVLIEEGIDSVDSFVSLTNLDEGNIFLSLFAKTRTNAKIITKVNRISFDNVVDTFKLGTIISPKNVTAQYIIRYIRALQGGIGSNFETLYKIFDNKVEALEFKIRKDASIVDKKLEDINLKSNILVAGIIRKGEVIIPHGKTKVHEEDNVIIVSTRIGLSNIDDILEDN